MTSPKCVWCPDLASLRVDSGVFLCSACWEKLADRIRIIDPSTSVRDTADVNVTAGAELAPEPSAPAVTANSLSDDARLYSLPSGEIEPSVTLASAPSESLSFDDGIPVFLRRVS